MIIRKIKRFILKIKGLNKSIIPGGLRFWVALSSCIFLGLTIYNNTENIRDIDFLALNYWLLFLALFLSFSSLFVNAFAWKILVQWLVPSSSRLYLINLYLSSNILKYLPGGIWHFIDRLRYLLKYIRKDMAFRAVLFEPILMVSAALLLLPLGGWQSGISLLSFTPIVLLFKPISKKLLSMQQLSKLRQLKKIDNDLSLDGDGGNLEENIKSYPVKAFIVEIIFILIKFSGLWFCFNSFITLSNQVLFEFLSAFCLAWSVGLVVPGAPGGLGVFESLFLIKIGNLVPEGILISSLLVYRFIVTLADLLAAFYAYFTKSVYKRNSLID